MHAAVQRTEVAAVLVRTTWACASQPDVARESVQSMLGLTMLDAPDSGETRHAPGETGAVRPGRVASGPTGGVRGCPARLLMGDDPFARTTIEEANEPTDRADQ